MTVPLLITALVLGIRHGLDIDHIAAILDVTSAPPASKVEGGGAGARGSSRSGIDRSSPRTHRQAALLGTMYAFGHAAVVASLGILALAFGAVLPDWFDAIMGRIVGITLVVLGTWVLASVILFARKGGQFQWRSRWMLVFIGASQLWSYLRRDPTASTRHAVRTYAPIGAFAVGAIHGIGAETATQVVVISGVAGTGGDAPTGMAMLAAFILGMLASNTAVIVMLAIGFAWGRAARRLTIAAGLATGALSVVVGSAFLLGLDLDSVFAIAAV